MKAAYCQRFYQRSISELEQSRARLSGEASADGKSGSGRTNGVSRDFGDVIAIQSRLLTRIQRYLTPRLAFVDAGGLTVAAGQADADFGSPDIDARGRRSSCAELSFLPY
ncbi:MAG: hypothetical protein ABSF50_12820 [Burkholderiaceae bacterium]